MELKKARIAIVYDWVDKWGGVERLLKVLHEMFPHAPLYTSYADTKNACWAGNLDLRTSFIQSLPSFIRKSRILSFLLYPYAFESFDFSGYDIVISVTSSFAKSVITKPGTLHLCILLTPTRYIWLYPAHYIKPFALALLEPFFSYMRRWDRIAGRRPDKVISISNEVASRCSKYYGLDSGVLYPPFDMAYWKKIKDENGHTQRNLPFAGKDYFLVVSRLEPYKKTDAVIDAFNGMSGRNLVVVGKGSRYSLLKKKVKSSNVLFLQDVDDRELAALYTHASALIMPQEEDFGYTALEAQYFGCPVLSYDRGGVKETVIDGKTGLFFAAQTGEAISGVLERYDKISYNLKHETKIMAYAQAQKFSKESFENKLEELIKNSVQ